MAKFLFNLLNILPGGKKAKLAIKILYSLWIEKYELIVCPCMICTISSNFKNIYQYEISREF
jgi:hypothetical protein